MAEQNNFQNKQNEAKNKMIKDNIIIVLFFAILVFGIFIGITVLTSTYTLYDVFGRICAAFIGTICTAVITLLLLRSQEKSQTELQNKQIENQKKWQEDLENIRIEAQQKQAELQKQYQEDLIKQQTKSSLDREIESSKYKEKLQIYKDFLNTLCDVIKDGEITKEEMTVIKFQTASISMHTSIENIESISKSFSNIMESLHTPTNKDDKDPVMGNLIEIIKCLKMELYKDNPKPTPEEDAMWESIIKYFTIDGDSEDESDSKSDNNKFDKVWDNWINTDSNNSLYLKNVNCEDMEIYIGGKEYCTIEAAYKHEGLDCSKALKREFGGNRWYGVWIKKFDGEFADIKRSDFYEELKTNTKLQEYVKEWYDKLIPCLEKYHETLLLKQAIKQSFDGQKTNNKWNSWIWEYSTIVIDYSDENNNPYLDIKRNEDGIISVILGIRKGRKEDLDRIMKEIFNSVGKKIENDGRYQLTSFSKNTSQDEVVKSVIEFMKKLDPELSVTNN